jgi:type I restriction enzyme R subunit
VIRKEFFHGFDYAGHEDPKKALSLLAPAMEHLLQVDPKEDEKGRNRGIRAYLDQVAKLTKAQALAGTTGAAMALREEIAFFQALRVSLIKLTRAGLWRSQVEKEAALRQLVARGVLVEGVNDIFTTLGLGKPDISVLDEAFLAQIQAMPTKNLAAELLERLIADQIKARGQKNAIQGKEFAHEVGRSDREIPGSRDHHRGGHRTVDQARQRDQRVEAAHRHVGRGVRLLPSPVRKRIGRAGDG